MTSEAQGVHKFFIGDQLDLINGVLNRLIPAHHEMPGAGELAVARYMDKAIADSPGLMRLFSEGLVQVTVVSHNQHSKPFAELSDGEKDGVLNQVETDLPHFFDLLVRYAYNGYYTNSRVIQLLGLESRPPQPRGYQLDVGDLSSLENVRQRGKAYREI